MFLVLTVLLLVSCRQKIELTVIKAKENPWPDNYTHISEMKHYAEWGTYNIHDPYIINTDEYYYMYSTDAIFREKRRVAAENNIHIGNIQVRRSKDLVNWEFLGWAFPEIPSEAVEWVHKNNDNKGATNIWAPCIIKHKDVYRLYYSVSAFGKKISYIGLAESSSPEGPWVQKGCVVKTNKSTPMNAIDPSVIEDAETGRMWMHYGSYFGGLYAVELNPRDGLPLASDDQGHLIARRANYQVENLEAPEIIYHPELKKYFLFVSYGDLMDNYNIRVGRSDTPEGPFYDYFGNDMKDTTNNYPVIQAPYKFDNHQGWVGTAHCGAVRSSEGEYFMANQGRLSQNRGLMVLHLREVFFTKDGWAVVSPERYAGTTKGIVDEKDISGNWELIHLAEQPDERGGVELWSDKLNTVGWNHSFLMQLNQNGKSDIAEEWSFSKKDQMLTLNINGITITNLYVFRGHDWENSSETLLFTGLDSDGRTVWGKKVE